MGSDSQYPEEASARDVEVDGFWLSPTTAINARFAAFVEATGSARRPQMLDTGMSDIGFRCISASS